MALDRVDTICLSQHVHIGRLLDQNEQCCLVDGSYFAWVTSEWTFLDWLDKRLHRHCVMIEISDDWRSLAVATRNASSLKGDLLGDLRQLYVACLVTAGLKHF